MEGMDKIELVIDGKPFPIQVTHAEKVFLSGLESSLNARIKEFQLQYSSLSKEDTLTMVMISVAFECEKAKKQLKNLEKSMESIEEVLSS